MIPYSVPFWSYLIFLIASIFCSVSVLYYFLSERNLRHALNNHVIIVLLFIGLLCEVTTYPWMLHYYRNEGIWRRSFIFCDIWAFVDWSTFVLQSVLVAWATIERRILIFHERWVSTKKETFPWLSSSALLLASVLSCLIHCQRLFPFCDNFFDIPQTVCVSPCLYSIIVASGENQQIVT